MRPKITGSINEDEAVRIGRVTLQRHKEAIAMIKSKTSIPFAFTHQSLCLLERIAVSVDQNEPVLLCGETGTGKTSSIQYLAHLLGKSLRIVNMNQQSDSCDLIGGYKPVELRIMLAPLKADFEDLFAKTFNANENATFLTHISTNFKVKIGMICLI